MKITLAPYEKRSINSSGGYFTVLNIASADSVELSFKGSDDIPLEHGSQIKVGNVAQVTLQNLNDSNSDIEFNISTSNVERKAQALKAEITNTNPIKIEMDRDVNIGAVAQEGQWEVGVKNATANIDKPRVECLAGQVVKLFDAASRKSYRLNVRSDQHNGVSLGGSTVNDGSGGYLEAGGVDFIDTSGELWAFNAGDESVYVDILELV